MKKMTFVLLLMATMFSSCYSYTTIVGSGPKGNEQVSKWNHYVIDGLIPVGVSDSKEMAGGATNYSVFTRHTFINGLIAGLTGGIYTPTTTTVTK